MEASSGPSARGQGHGLGGSGHVEEESGVTPEVGGQDWLLGWVW